MKDKVITEEKIDKFVFYFSIFDILFLPYIWCISTNYSLIFVFIWSIIRCRELIKMREFNISVIASMFIALGTILSFVYYPKYLASGDEIWIQNGKMMLQYISYFMYYIMFVYCIKKYDIKIKKILLGLMGFATALAIIYMIDKELFANIKLLWNNVDSFSIWFKEGREIQYRYNFVWTDPNNPAYAFVAVMTYLLLNEKTNIFEKIFAVISTIFLVICSMSTGATLSLALATTGIIGFTLIPKLKEYKNKIRLKMNKKKVLIFTTITILLVIISIFIIKQLQNTSIYQEAITRIFGNTEEGSTSRIEIWKTVLSSSNIIKNIFLGTGGRQVIIDNEKIIAPHNGHLYFIYSYGMIFYGIFMYEFFRKRKNVPLEKYLFVLPIFIGFTINTMVGEQKFMILYLLLYTMTYITNNKKKEESEKVESIN